MNPTPSPSNILIELVGETAWWDAPFFSVLASLLAAILGSGITIWAASRTESAQDRRTARAEVFAGFEVLASNHEILYHSAWPINSGDSHKQGLMSDRIMEMLAEMRSASRRIRVFDRTLDETAKEYIEALVAVSLAGNSKGEEPYPNVVHGWNEKFETLEMAVSKRVGIGAPSRKKPDGVSDLD